MAHLTCKRHKARVLVTPAQQILHRATNALCKGTVLVYRGTELSSTQVVQGETKSANI